MLLSAYPIPPEAVHEGWSTSGSAFPELDLAVIIIAAAVVAYLIYEHLLRWR